MKYLLLILFLLASPCMAAGPKYSQADPQLQDEIENIYKDIRNVLNGDVRISSLTVTTCTGCSSASQSLTISTLTVTSSVTLQGVTDGSSASAGKIGELFISSVPVQVNFPTSTQLGDLASFTLTAGDWQVSAMLFADRNGANWDEVIVGISTTSGNSRGGMVDGIDNSRTDESVLGTTILYKTMNVIKDFNFSTSKTVYLKYASEYNTATPQAKGALRARRMR